MAVGEELDGVDVGLVAGKCLDRLSGANVPELGKGIAGARDECVLVGRVEADAHDVAEVVGELGHLLTRLNVPLHTRHVARRGQDGAVIDEAAAGEVSGVARELPGHPCGAVALLVEVVDGAYVVEAAAGDKVPARGVGARHDPRGSQRNRVDLVGAVGVPDDQLTILRGRDEMSSVSRPMHSINLCEMALERALGLHLQARERLGTLACDITDCDEELAGVSRCKDERAYGEHTRCVGELILLLLYAILEGLCIPTGD